MGQPDLVRISTVTDDHPWRDGRPSRWNTLRAMRVLDWYERGR